MSQSKVQRTRPRWHMRIMKAGRCGVGVRPPGLAACTKTRRPNGILVQVYGIARCTH